jgi:hypothetical protein
MQTLATLQALRNVVILEHEDLYEQKKYQELEALVIKKATYIYFPYLLPFPLSTSLSTVTVSNLNLCYGIYSFLDENLPKRIQLQIRMYRDSAKSCHK